MTEKSFTYNDFIRYFPVSRETFEQMGAYAEFLKKWQRKINLIGGNTVSNIWLRHVIDSAQLANYLGKDESVMDMGSGAGFPGMVLTILGIKHITLVESDRRKAAFLREAARELNININIVCQRVEKIALEGFSVLTARAFAPIKDILTLIGGSLNPNHKLLLLKGKDYNQEIGEARRGWGFDYNIFPNVANEDGVVLLIQNITQEGNPHAKPA